MADIDVEESAVTDAATFLYNNRDSILDSLIMLQGAVTNLLTQGGGLWLRMASPVMSSSFVTFQHDLTDAITNIGSFADTFKNTVDNLNQLDTGYAQPPKDDGSSGSGAAPSWAGPDSEAFKPGMTADGRAFGPQGLPPGSGDPGAFKPGVTVHGDVFGPNGER